jgi:hypothetical protein
MCCVVGNGMVAMESGGDEKARTRGDALSRGVGRLANSGVSPLLIMLQVFSHFEQGCTNDTLGSIQSTALWTRPRRLIPHPGPSLSIVSANCP